MNFPSSVPCNNNGVKTEASIDKEYFEDFMVEEFMTLGDGMEKVKSIISIKSNVVIDGIEFCNYFIELIKNNTIEERRVLKVRLKSSFQLKYVGGKDNKSVYSEGTHFFKFVYIPIHKYINGVSSKDLLRRGKLITTVHVEDISATILSEKVMKISLIGITSVGFI